MSGARLGKYHLHTYLQYLSILATYTTYLYLLPTHLSTLPTYLNYTTYLPTYLPMLTNDHINANSVPITIRFKSVSVLTLSDE